MQWGIFLKEGAKFYNREAVQIFVTNGLVA